MNEKLRKSYRILRLRSGQDVITRIVGKKRNNLVIERPMQMKVSSIFDGMSQREVLVFRNWLQFTDSIQTQIPKDWIASFLEPVDEVIELYNIEKKKEDDIKKELKRLEDAEPLEKLMIVKEVMDNIRKIKGTDEPVDEKEPNYKDMVEPGSIIVNLAIPPNIFFQMISEGMLENFDLEHIMGSTYDDMMNDDFEKFTDVDTSNEIDREDYGSKWTDWSPNIEDYLNDE